jgi:phosphatidylserine/phosphatidylglycerophosphate/cardiolipin synthase-like enzyme
MRPGLRQTITGGLTLLMLLAAVLLAVVRQPNPPPVAESAAQGAWYSVYFTDPGGPASDTLRGGPDQALAEAIDAARYSVDVAAYHLDLWSIRDSLLGAASRGVSVRLIVDSDNLLEPEVQDLVEAGIPVLGDRRQSLMHHKFVVIDRQEVWTGSMNLTIGDAYRSSNNLIRLRSSQLAESFTREFDEMALDDRFGAMSLADTPYPDATIDGTRMEVFFSPDDGVARRLLELVRGARHTVEFLAYAFTADELALALLDADQAGIEVRGVLDAGQVNDPASEYDRLRSAGIDVRLDGLPGNLHHKVILIDREIVITGSYNFSASAEEHNDENLVVLHSPAIAEAYLAEFSRQFDEAQPD